MLLLALEELLNLARAHGVEVVGNPDLTGHETEAFHPRRFGRVERNDFDHWFAGFGDEEGFAIGGLLDEAREVGFRVVNVVGFHGCSHILKFITMFLRLRIDVDDRWRFGLDQDGTK